MRKRNPDKWVDAIALLLVFIIFCIGYRWFYHHGPGMQYSNVRKMLLYLFWFVSVFAIGFTACKYWRIEKHWSALYSVLFISVLILRIIELKTHSFFLLSVAAQLKLFMCSPLPY